MSFIDHRLSKNVEAGFSGGPEWSTLVVQMASGMERRNAQWSMPHFKFSADYTILNPREQNEILAGFMAARGQLHCFRFKDWNDFKAEGMEIGVGDGASDPLQLLKHYEFGPTAYSRIITLPVSGTVKVYENGSPKTVTVDYQTGEVTPSTPWTNAAVITADFEFDVKVRFGADHYAFTQHAKSVSQVSIDLVEVLQ